MSDDIRLLSTLDCAGIHLNNSGIQHPDPRHSFGPILRTEYILQYVTAGRGVLKLRGKTYDLGPGDLFLLEPDTLLYYAAEPSDPYTYFWAGFSGPGAGELAAQAGFSPDRHVRHLSDERVESCMRELFGHASDATEGGRFFGVSAFFRLIGLLAGDRPRSESVQSAYVAKALRFVEEHYAEEIGVREISAHVGLNRSYFSVIFKRAMGVSPATHLIDYRLTQASRLLSTGRSITEISSLCGFPDAANFSVRFKQHSGFSPREYRRMVQK